MQFACLIHTSSMQAGPCVTALSCFIALIKPFNLSNNWAMLAWQMTIFGPLAAMVPVIGYALFPPEVRRGWQVLEALV